MNLKDWIKLLNIRDDLMSGNVDSKELMRKVPEHQFKMMFWSVASLFKQLKQEAERRGIWDEMIKRRPEPEEKKDAVGS